MPHLDVQLVGGAQKFGGDIVHTNTQIPSQFLHARDLGELHRHLLSAIETFVPALSPGPPTHYKANVYQPMRSLYIFMGNSPLQVVSTTFFTYGRLQIPSHFIFVNVLFFLVSKNGKKNKCLWTTISTILSPQRLRRHPYSIFYTFCWITCHSCCSWILTRDSRLLAMGRIITIVNMAWHCKWGEKSVWVSFYPLYSFESHHMFWFWLCPLYLVGQSRIWTEQVWQRGWAVGDQMALAVIASQW